MRRQVFHCLLAGRRTIDHHQHLAQRRTASAAGAHHHHRPLGILNDLLGHAAQQDAQCGAQPLGANQDQIGVNLFGIIDDRRSGVAALQQRLDREALPAQACGGFIQGSLHDLVAFEVLGGQHTQGGDLGAQRAGRCCAYGRRCAFGFT